MYTNLKEQWQLLAAAYTTDAALVGNMWAELETAYTGSERHYHNLHHLGFMMEQLRQHEHLISDFHTVAFAVFYHDIVYSPSRSDNEERSAALAAERLAQLSVPPEKAATCSQLILGTKTHKEVANPDANYLTDSDLAILGVSWPLYKNYAENIRKEYSMYPNVLYRNGRRKVLLHFLAMNRIFKAEAFYSQYEEQARQNVARELKEIEQAAIL